MFILIAILIIASITLITFTILPMLTDKAEAWRRKKEAKVAVQLDNLFYNKSPKVIVRLYFILPPILALAGSIIFRSIIAMAAGALLGLFIPSLILKIRNIQRRIKFNQQTLDMIMILSSSLKGGLSLLQALEVVVEEMPAPMSQEIGLVVRENKMGVTLEESLKHLNKRMEMEELGLVINSILVARETGGDLTKVLSRLSTTIRDNRKLKENIKTLTLQGRLQGIIMSILPIVFVWWVMAFDRHHFDIMLQTEVGRTLLFVALILEVIGTISIKKFSTVKI